VPFITRQRHRIHYTTYGDRSSPALLLVMGMGVSSRGWGALPEKLAQHFFVITFDNRGTGHSSTRPGFLKMREMAEDAVAVLDAVGVPSRQNGGGGANVFGISMGGMIAQELALRHPERVRALALGATHASYLVSRKPSLSAAVDFVRVVARGAGNRPGVIGRLLTTPAFVAANPDVVGSWFLRSDHARPLAALSQLCAVMGHHTSPRLKQITCPTLVLSGDQDRLVPVQNAYVLAGLIPNAKLVILQGAGHVFPLEQEDQTARALMEHFLAPDLA
jgi:pimeloyl-ACP methyl ester carboxylesterase